ncbi:MAG: sugar phosphate isomerase/epimerase [Roseburia sp.]|nr:sugar phosphate isomerase/epimerase [Roseburia sp.]
MEKRQLFEMIAVGTNIAMGYPLADSLAMLANMGVKHVELSSIAGMCEHVDPNLINEEYAAWVSQLLQENHLSCNAVAGHVDLTEEDQLRDFLKKIEFTGRIGAKYINTNSGPLLRLDTFHQNMRKVIAQAEKWNVTVCLESHGDIIGSAQDSVSYIEEFHHPLVRMNYDTGNTYFYEKGMIDIAEDLAYSRDVISYMHIKDLRIEGEKVTYTAIGNGNLDFRKIFRQLHNMGKCIPASLEIPVFVSGTLQGIGPQNPPISKEEIERTIRQSFAFVEETILSI